MEAEQSKCPSCNGDMRQIMINDATSVIPNRVGIGHVEPTYSAMDAKASWFTGKVPPEGTVKARICTTCGQILLFGVPK